MNKEKGWIDEQKIVYETLISIKRSGASCILTYFAKDIAINMNAIRKK